MQLALVLVSSVLFASTAAARVGHDPDTDGDGLSDFREVHKHLTDPHAADSDGDGLPDGDWEERREYAYSVRSILQVLPPVNRAEITDDYQDARVLEEREDCVEIEVIHYPLNTVASAITESARWQDDPSSPKEYLASGPTTNWDAGLRARLLADLKRDGIDVVKLSDRAVVEQVSAWLMKGSKFEDGFTTFMVDFEGGKPRPSEGQEARFAEELAKQRRTAQQQWDRELFGKAMIENRVRGTCTSSAIYLSTGLRSVGIPTRTIVCTPVIDANDPREIEMVRRGIRNHAVREAIETFAQGNLGGWTSHTFNEVWVGGRWRRLNYAVLGQNILDEEFMGLMTHVHTFADHADSGMSRTWGLRSTRGRYDDVFGTANPYSCISLSERFGVHARVENTVRDVEPVELVISRLYWYEDPKRDRALDMQLDTRDGAGHLVFHCDEGAKPLSLAETKRFYERAPKDFVLRPVGDKKGRPDVPAVATRGYWIDSGRGLRDFYLRIEPEHFKQMKSGVPYLLSVLDAEGDMRWRIGPDVKIVRR